MVNQLVNPLHNQTAVLLPWRQQVLTLVARIGVLFALPLVVVDTIMALQTGELFRIPLNLIGICVLLVASLARVHIVVRAALLLSAVYTFATVWLVLTGLVGTGRTYLLMLTVLAALLLNRRGTLLVWLLALLTSGAVYGAFLAEWVPLPIAIVDRMFTPLTLTTQWLVQVLVTGVVSGTVLFTVGRLQHSLQTTEAARTALERFNGELEQRIAERTAELEAANEALRTSEARLRSVWETALDAMVITDAAGTIQSANPAYYRLYGYQPDEMLGHSFAMVLPSARRTAAMEDYQRIFGGPNDIAPVETIVQGADGRERVVEATFSFLSENGQRVGLLSVIHDINDRKQIERDLFRSRELLRGFFDHSPMLMYEKDCEGRYTQINHQMAAVLNRPYQQVIGQTVIDFFSTETAHLLNATDQQVITKNRPHIDEQQLSLNGKTSTFLTVKFPIYDMDGSITSIGGISLDITERKRMNEALEEQARLQAVHDERTRLARDLHDSVSQTLYSVNLYTDTMRMMLDSSPEPDQGTADCPLDQAELLDYVCELQHLTRAALLDMRLLIFALRSPLLQEQGLVGAIQARLDSVEQRSGIQTSLQVVGECRLPTTFETELYHILQEALNNIVKHARASEVTIMLECTAQQINLDVRDNGIGFDLNHTPQQTGGMGLRGMQERVEYLGGTLNIDSVPGGGTCVRVELASSTVAEGDAHGDT